ncbi:MAG: hypothetical protein VX642_00650 [Bdellovibrionota bacterium]|nr:hypothetical protein [Bdellovibrionota bacterium]
MKRVHSTAKYLQTELSLNRLKNLINQGKIQSIKDLCKYGFCPGVLVIENSQELKKAS